MLPLQKNFHSLEKSQYWMSKIIIRLKELDCSTEEIISSVKAYPLFENDSLDIIAYLESNEKEQECLDFMLTQLTFFDEGDNELYFLIEKASKLAKKLKNKQAYFQIMNASITHDFDSDKLLSDFKKMFKETEWEEHKIALFDYWEKKIDFETYLRILDTYSENEKLTEKLFKVDNIYILLRYLDVARNIDENMAIHLFIQLLMKKIKNKSTRYDYYRLCEEIRNLNQFSGGQDLIDECFVQLRLTFHDNKTFIEVLNEFEKEDEDKYENNY